MFTINIYVKMNTTVFSIHKSRTILNERKTYNIRPGANPIQQICPEHVRLVPNVLMACYFKLYYIKLLTYLNYCNETDLGRNEYFRTKIFFIGLTLSSIF